LLERANVATIHIVLSERTRVLIDGTELARMKPDAVLVNTSRGPIVAETALLATLRSGRPGCAAIDVYSDEPLAAAHPTRARDLIDAGKLLLTRISAMSAGRLVNCSTGKPWRRSRRGRRANRYGSSGHERR
jgi:phosphoglycerate dehydrogenase-like enzyme